MRDLYLHIGHNKTGTTYIQSVLSNNRMSMSQIGVDYPIHGADAQKVDLDKMTPAGNGMGLFAKEEHFKSVMSSRIDPKARKILFSSETMFDDFASKQNLDYINTWLEGHGIGRVSMLLFIRDPIDHAVSFWQQRVKGWQCETRTLDEYLEGEFNFPAQVAELIQKMEDAGLDCRVYHYREHKANLLEVLRDWLEVDQSFQFEVPLITVQNRSLSAGEVELQRAINRYVRGAGRIFAFHMANNSLSVPMQRITPSRSTQEIVLSRLRPHLEYVNERLPENERYIEDTTDRDPLGEVHFSLEQIQIIGQRIGLALRSGEFASPHCEGTLIKRVSRWTKRMRQKIGDVWR